MIFDFKKEFKEFYAPSVTPSIIDVPTVNYLAVRGKGDPNEVNGEYSKALELLYPVAYTIKMSHKSSYKINGFFEYVVPPLEGFWWQDDARKEPDLTRKDEFIWISVLRLPDFVEKNDFEWALGETERKKKEDFSKVEFFTYHEGLCVQCMHIGSYDDEHTTILMMKNFADAKGYEIDITKNRHHHEIYLSDPRKCVAGKLKTVIRYPVK